MSARSVFPRRAVFQSATPADRTPRRLSSVVIAHACERARARVCVRENGVRENGRPKKRVGTLNKKKALPARVETAAGGGIGV